VVALSNGNAFVVWWGGQSGTADIYGRVLAPNGTALTNDFTINQNTAGNQYVTSMTALSNDNAVAVWHGNQAGTWDAYGRVMAPNGTALTNDFTINQATTGTQDSAILATLSNGNVFVVWGSLQAGNGDIYGRVMSPTGTAVTDDFLINQYTTGDQYTPSVAALSNGNAFVVWQSLQTGTWDIYGRVVAPNGIPLADEFLINQNTTGNQENPSVATLNNGNTFVVWYGTQTGLYDVYGRVVSPNGAAFTDELMINQNTNGILSQYVPFVATLNNGNAFVVWQGNNNIYGRIFNLSDSVITTGFQTTGSQTTGFQTTELQTTGAQTTSVPLNPNNDYLFPILGVGAAAVGLSVGGSLITACALGGLYGIKKCKKQQQKQLKNLDVADASTTQPPSHVKTTNPYGTAVELSPTKQTYGTPPELLLKEVSNQKAAGEPRDTYGTPPEFFPAKQAAPEVAANTFTVIPPSHHTTRPQSQVLAEAYGTPLEIFSKGVSNQETIANTFTDRCWRRLMEPPLKSFQRGFLTRKPLQILLQSSLHHVIQHAPNRRCWRRLMEHPLKSFQRGFLTRKPLQIPHQSSHHRR
jgi:hypothetical protein